MTNYDKAREIADKMGKSEDVGPLDPTAVSLAQVYAILALGDSLEMLGAHIQKAGIYASGGKP